MTIRKKDFQRVVNDVKEFLTKLNVNNTSAELRDSLNFSLLHLHKYYKRLRHQIKHVTPLLDGSLSLSSSFGSLSPASPYIPPLNRFEYRWINLDVAKLSASFGHGEKSNLLPEIFYILKDGDVTKLKEMIEKDEDCVNEVDALGRTTASYCIHGGSAHHLECLDVLIDHNVDLKQEFNDGLTCLHLAALFDNENALEKIISTQINVNVEDNEGRYPLHFAAGYAAATFVQKLLDAGADKTSLDNDELTPAMWACHFDKCENVEVLLKITHEDEMRFEIIDAEIQDKDVNGRNLIHWSVSRCVNKHCFKLLFSSDYADLVDDNKKTALHFIAEYGAAGALEEYLAVCDDKHFQSNDSADKKPLHLACMHGHGEVVDALLNRGAILDIMDNQGLTPLDYAKSKNLNYCMLVIISHQKYRNKSSPNHKKKYNVQTTKSKENEKLQITTKPSAPKSIDPVTSLNVVERRNSIDDVSQFDTPQDYIDNGNCHVDVSKNENKYADIEEYDDVEMNLNDQLIVLVEHHGSDDELVIDVDGINDQEFGGKADVDIEEDHDLLDAPAFARNGSITTVGVVSEGNLAFNSVSVHPSVSSLGSSGDESDHGYSKNKMQPRRSSGYDQSEGNRYDNNNVPKRDRNMERPGSHNVKKPFSKQKPVHSQNSPRHATASPAMLNYDVTAPVPSPSNLCVPNQKNRHSDSQVLVIHGSDRNAHGHDRNEKHVDIRQKRSMIHQQSTSQSFPPEQRKAISSNHSLEQSWPPMFSSHADDEQNTARQLSPCTTKLAPLSAHSIPRPPSYK